VSGEATTDLQPAAHRPLVLGVVVAALLALPFLGDRLVLAFFRIPLNYNEGWNAYHSLRLLQGRALYPPVDGLLLNNYPPLSFYVVAGVGRLTHDLVMAGRIVAILSFAVVVLNVGLATASLARSRTAGWYGSALFAAMFGVFYGRYFGIDDPQMLAHALMTTVLVLCLRHWDSGRAVGWALLLALAAGLTKHNLLALPVALALASWASGTRRGLAVTLGGAALAGAAVGALALIYGPVVFASLLAPRTWSAYAAAESISTSLLPLAPLMACVAVALWTWTWRGPDLLVLLYALLSLPLAVVLAGGAGVRESIYFDTLIPGVIIAAVTVARALQRVAGTPLSRMAAVLPIALCAAPAIGLLPGLTTLKWHWVDGEIAAARRDTPADIRRITGAGGPVLCESLSLCYWAGVPQEADLFNAEQGFATGRLNRTALAHRISSGDFALIQLDAGTINSERWDPALDSTLRSRYQLADSSSNGLFLTPR
jgi:hypothetical protein